MMKRSPILSLAAVANFAVLWFVLDADPHFRNAAATTTTAMPPEVVAPESFRTAHAANKRTMRILALDQAKHLAFWTSVLKNRKQACDAVVRTMYQGDSESGVDAWRIGCRDGNEYSITINPDAQGSEAEFPGFGLQWNRFRPKCGIVSSLSVQHPGRSPLYASCYPLSRRVLANVRG
ncbi:hypothetical protein [Bradyrhizobium sp. LM6.9]